MERKSSAVQKPRPYDSTRRRQQARETRDAILDAAHSFLLSGGFVPTTIASIAEEAGVSVDTIYKTYGGKAGLVRAICQRALAGEGPIPAETRSDALQSTEADPRAIIRGFQRHFATKVLYKLINQCLKFRDMTAGGARRNVVAMVLRRPS